MEELSKSYDPKKVEKKIYNLWQKSGFFNPDKLPGRRKKTYTICLPPPNITGELHMGHALNAIAQDIVTRKKRMQGFKTLWLPGIDHAGIATQNVVEKELKKEGVSRFNLGREKFIERVWTWRKQYSNIILEQFKKLGCSLDWSRIRFTMDKDYERAVKFAFLHYYKKGWIYRGEKVVNWCPRCQTSLSDLELEYREEKGKLYFLRYPVRESGFIVVATTRPETLLGDTAVAINPKDKRYKATIGKKVVLPIQNREIPIIADMAVDPNFGTGAVKVTPAHDPIDWEIKERHNLKSIKVIDEKGLMTKEAKICRGLRASECRQEVLKILEKENLIEKIEDHTHSLPYCYRCHTLIEPLLSLQWFLKMEKLAPKALEVVKKSKIKFHPRKWEKIYSDWISNIKDWCISRQIWWGHKIPLKGEDDVLDTWFSSALWPFATLGWPKRTQDLKNFYPTDVLSTDRGIINLWVARMVFSGMEFMGMVPFKNVYIHATVLTKQGKRMSKSLGTGINPITLIEKYGADATRFGIIWQTMGGQDIRFAEESIVMGKKFCNKIWNATRFVMLQITNSKLQVPSKFQISSSKLTSADRKILKVLNETIKSVNKDLDNFQFGQAAHKIYDFFWHDFCDIYIEKSKKQLDESFHHGEFIHQTRQILSFVLLNSLKLLHPFIPFITEEIYQMLPQKSGKALIVEKWPS